MLQFFFFFNNSPTLDVIHFAMRTFALTSVFSLRKFCDYVTVCTTRCLIVGCVYAFLDVTLVHEVLFLFEISVFYALVSPPPPPPQDRRGRIRARIRI